MWYRICLLTVSPTPHAESCNRFHSKNIDIVLLIHAIFRMVTALSFVTCIELREKVREEKYVVENMIAQVGARVAAPKSARLRLYWREIAALHTVDA